MTGQRWLIVGVSAILLGGSGCVSCGHRGYSLARDIAPECDLPTCQRSEVYVFAMSGLNPVSVMALDDLREELNRHGFAKVATGQTIHSGWMAREMRRIHTESPNAVFVVVGFESAGPAAVRLAEKVAADGLPVGGLVVIDSEGKTRAPATGIRTLAIGNVEAISASDAVDSIAAPNVSSYGLASDSRTVKAVHQMLSDLAAGVPVPVVEERTEWEYPHAPPMRPIGEPTRDPDWIFLFDQQSVGTRPTPSPGPVPAFIPAYIPAGALQPASAPLRSSIR